MSEQKEGRINGRCHRSPPTTLQRLPAFFLLQSAAAEAKSSYLNAADCVRSKAAAAAATAVGSDPSELGPLPSGGKEGRKGQRKRASEQRSEEKRREGKGKCEAQGLPAPRRRKQIMA